MPKKPRTKKVKFPHYWLCAGCAAEKGGELVHSEGITMCLGTCQYCNGDNQIGNALIPWVDLNWPKDKKADATAKINRALNQLETKTVRLRDA